MQIHYDPTNKPFRVQRGPASTEFWYGTDDQRYFQREAGVGDTIYIGKLFEQKSNGQKKYYLGNYAVLTADASSGDSISYLHKDRLGSIIAISDEDGDNEQGSGRGFDPFGKPREEDWGNVPPGGGDDLNGYDTTTRGFTGHEHLNGTDLIHMNGRAYDYNLGRFLSVDPVIQFPANSQSLNPYSYIMNNPMAGTDPTGYTGGCPESDPECNSRKNEDEDDAKPGTTTDKCGRGASCVVIQLNSGEGGDNTTNLGDERSEILKEDQRSHNGSIDKTSQDNQMNEGGCHVPLLCADNVLPQPRVLVAGTGGNTIIRFVDDFRGGLIAIVDDVTEGNFGMLSGFVREEGLGVVGRTATVLGGGAQVVLGGAICYGSSGLACAGGVGIGTLGVSNIQEGFSGSDGFARNGFQVVLGENEGDLAFGVINLGTSAVGLARPILKPGTFKLFRNVQSDFEPAIRQTTRGGLGAEAIISGAGIVDTVDRLNDDE